MNKDPNANNDLIYHLIGWVLFIVCAVLYLAAGLRTGDVLTIVGSVVFLVACFVFLVPVIRGLGE